MSVMLPEPVRARLAQLAGELPPEVYAEVARRLRERTHELARTRAAAAYPEHDSPGKLAMELGEQQTRHLAILDNLHIRARHGEPVRATVAFPPRHGKALALDTPLPTPTGWTTMGEVNVGDELLDDQGRPCRVTYTSPVFLGHDCYEVRTNDGERIVADAGHRWRARLDRRTRWSTYTTEVLARSRTKRAQIPTAAPLDLPDADLPLPPYVLGVWLGDGASYGASITCADQQIIDEIRAEGIPCRQRPGDPLQWTLVAEGRTPGPAPSPVRAALVSLGVWANKHVPDLYARGSRAQRLALLQGLVDSDGHVMTDGSVEVTVTNGRLARDVQHLVATLGAKATCRESRALLNGRDCGPRWRVQFMLADAARLDRKRIRCRDSRVASIRYVRASPVPSVPTRCVEVDSPSHLYLAGRSLLVTHNTQRLIRVGNVWRLDQDPDCRVMAVSGSKAIVADSSRWVRDELERTDRPYKVRPRRDVRSVSDWKLEGHEGGMLVGSMGSRIIGRGANLLEVDDLLGSPKEAESEPYRKSAWRFLQSAMGRLEPGAAVIVVNSRWHAEDPIGMLHKEQPGLWEHYSIPALAEEHGPREDPEDPRCKCGDLWGARGHADLLDRDPGQPLWPERFDVDALAGSRLLLGSHYFSAQFQQRPKRREGGLWKEAWITDRREAELTVEQQILTLTARTVAVDPSASDEDTGDEAGIVCGGKRSKTGEAVVTADLSGIYTPEGWARTALVAAIELEATVVYEKNLTPALMRRSFAAAWEALKREAADNDGNVAAVLGMAPVELPRLMPRLEPVNAKVGKVLRAEPVAQRYEQRRVIHAGVFPALEDQLLTWMSTDKDSPDRMDAVVHLVTWLGDTSGNTTKMEQASGTVPTGASAVSNRYT